MTRGAIPALPAASMTVVMFSTGEAYMVISPVKRRRSTRWPFAPTPSVNSPSPPIQLGVMSQVRGTVHCHVLVTGRDTTCTVSRKSPPAVTVLSTTAVRGAVAVALVICGHLLEGGEGGDFGTG